MFLRLGVCPPVHTSTVPHVPETLGVRPPVHMSTAPHVPETLGVHPPVHTSSSLELLLSLPFLFPLNQIIQCPGLW